MQTSSALNPFGLPPEEAIRWFREKGYALNFDWRDMMGEQHARAFSVAKATQLDILADLREAVERAIAKGSTLAEFKRDVAPTLKAKGWWGQQEVVDPVTGERTLAQLGSPNRLRTIYETNLRGALAAGRWERVERTAERRPWLRYVAIDDGRTRAEHKAWHGTILRWDDPWWRTHAPPNGWGCRCKIVQLSDRDLDRYGLKPNTQAPASKTRLFLNERTGETLRVPRGIDPGFDFNAGMARGAVRPINQQALEMRDVRTWRDLGRPDLREVARAQPKSPALLNPERTAEERAATEAEFDLMFGLKTPESEGIMTDPSGMQVRIGRRFLEHLRGAHDRTGSDRTSRVRYLPLVRETVERPTEIWMVPFRMNDGRVVMRKRYIGVWADRQELVVVERQPDGELVWTALSDRNLNAQRKGYLLFPR